MKTGTLKVLARSFAFKYLRRTRVFFTVISVVFVVYILFFTDIYFGYSKPNATTQSQHPPDKDNVYIKLKPSFPQDSKTIFFLETSSSNFISSRLGCSVESAAKHHPHLSVLVLLYAKRVRKDSVVEVLLGIPNVRLARLDLDALYTGSPLSSWYFKSEWSSSAFKTTHLSDATRIALLLKYGGIYQDIDSMTIKSFTQLLGSNILATHNYQTSAIDINNGVLLFQSNHSFLLRAAHLLQDNYDKDDWVGAGPRMLQEALFMECPKRYGFCEAFNVTLAPSEYFYPIHWREVNNVAVVSPAADKDVEALEQKSFAVHFYNSQTSRFADIPRNSLYAKLAARHCPAIYGKTFLECSSCTTEYALARLPRGLAEVIEGTFLAWPIHKAILLFNSAKA